MRVLIVDDDMAIVDAIKNYVNWDKLGVVEVHCTYNIEQAKDILKHNSVDIIVSDIEMPKGSGLDLLSWIRKEQIEAEFILLTCHENFTYATNAVKLRAAEYLLKPFDTEVMEQALQKLVIQIAEKRMIQEESNYGKWMKKNRRQMQIDFFSRVLEGKLSGGKDRITQVIANQKLMIDVNDDYNLIISKVTDTEKDKERMNANLLAFIMENIHSEVLFGNPVNYSVCSYDFKDYYILVSTCAAKEQNELKSMCESLLEKFRTVLNSTITCCISRTCTISEFYNVYHRDLELIASNVVSYGNYFFETSVTQNCESERSILELNVLVELISDKKKMEFMSYLKTKLNEKAFEKTLNDQVLLQVKQEILQAIYIYLAKRDIAASELFMDEISINMSRKAALSVINMIRWVNYVLEKTFEVEEQAKKGHSVIDKINQYIREHYMENIGRNEIAAQFYLAPEYLSRMYKKQCGQTLKDFISEYRIEQAKILLKKDEMSISDVAGAVGFDNFTYFSTVFKKITGVTPNQYRKE